MFGLATADRYDNERKGSGECQRRENWWKAPL